MHQRLALRIGFNAERCVTKAMRLHLLGKESLKLLNTDFHRLNQVFINRKVLGQEIDQPHGARRAYVQSRQPLASRAGMIALPLLIIEWRTEVHTVGGRRMGNGQRRENESD